MSDLGGPGEDPVEAELRRLFADERLEVQPKDGAGEAVVVGARRIRRRRAALAGSGTTLAVLALVGGAFLLNNTRTPGELPDAHIAAPPGTSETTRTSLTGEAPSNSSEEPRGLPSSPKSSGDVQGTSSRTPPASSPAKPTTSTAAEGSAFATASTLGPDGYQSLTLGMSYQDASATGMLADGQQTPPPENACSTYKLAEGTSVIHDLTISASRGIVIFRAGDARTAEGIGTGSSLDQVRAAYPDLKADGSGYSAAAGETGRYYFTTTGETVDEVQLRAPDPAC